VQHAIFLPINLLILETKTYLHQPVLEVLFVAITIALHCRHLRRCDRSPPHSWSPFFSHNAPAGIFHYSPYSSLAQSSKASLTNSVRCDGLSQKCIGPVLESIRMGLSLRYPLIARGNHRHWSCGGIYVHRSTVGAGAIGKGLHRCSGQ
jgi:hypothetical protein